MVELLTVTGFRVEAGLYGTIGVVGAIAARDAGGATTLGAPATLSGTFDLETGTTAVGASVVRDASAAEADTTGLGSGALATKSFAAEGTGRSAGGATGAMAGGGSVFADIARVEYAGSEAAAAPVDGGKTRVRPKNGSVAPAA